MLGLKMAIFWLANCARRSLRMSSSVLPENIEPQMTSMQPDFLKLSEYIFFGIVLDKGKYNKIFP